MEEDVQRAAPEGELSEPSEARLVQRWLTRGLDPREFVADSMEAARQRWSSLTLPSRASRLRCHSRSLPMRWACIASPGAWWTVETRRLPKTQLTRDFWLKGERVQAGDGTYWRRDSTESTEHRLRLIDRGEVILTTSRVVLTGASRSRTIRLNQIARAYVVAQGIDLQLTSGVAPFLEIHRATEFAALLRRVAPPVAVYEQD